MLSQPSVGRPGPTILRPGPNPVSEGPSSLQFLGLGWARGPVAVGKWDGMGRFGLIRACLLYAASVFPEGWPSKHLPGTCGRVSSVAGTFADRAACPVKLPHAPSPHHGTAPPRPALGRGKQRRISPRWPLELPSRTLTGHSARSFISPGTCQTRCGPHLYMSWGA